MKYLLTQDWPFLLDFAVHGEFLLPVATPELSDARDQMITAYTQPSGQNRFV